MTVTSHTAHLPVLQGTNVMTSGRFPSDLDKPTGSFTDGISAWESARQIVSSKLCHSNCDGDMFYLNCVCKSGREVPGRRLVPSMGKYGVHKFKPLNESHSYMNSLVF